jgi:hypothetical protein
MARFFVAVMQDYYREMIAHLRGIGVKVPINGTNWSTNLGVLAAQRAADFEDSHTYWNFPTWESPQGIACRPMLGEPDTTFNDLSMERTLDRPFVVSEWDHAWPDPYRCESPLWYAAVGALTSTPSTTRRSSGCSRQRRSSSAGATSRRRRRAWPSACPRARAIGCAEGPGRSRRCAS